MIDDELHPVNVTKDLTPRQVADRLLRVMSLGLPVEREAELFERVLAAWRA